jgi:dihydrofolate synthase/folylpolyglutamate synthase
MTYEQTINYLYNSLPMFQRIGNAAFKKSLDNIIELCQVLDNPQHKFKSIHIAGTNGKGSTAHTMAAVLQSAGYKTGLYTSPHLKSFTERIRINGEEIAREKVVQFVEDNKHHFERIKPSFFEMTVAMAFDHFAKEQVDIAIVEVGLGGRLDSTNIINPVLSIITNISYDHQDLLGNTLPEIASEKAGIIKPGVPVIISEKQPEVTDVFEEKAAKENTSITFSSDLVKIEAAESEDGILVVNANINGFPRYKNLKYQLSGIYQHNNIAGILQAIESLRAQQFQISDTAVYEGFAHVTDITGLRGRWQVLSQHPKVICDTGHNEAGIKNVVTQLASLSHRQLHIVIGMVNDKSHDKVMKLLPSSATYYFCQANIPRAMEAHQLAALAATYELRGKVIKDVNEAILDALTAASPEDLIFIGGSTFIVAEIDEEKIKSFSKKASEEAI